MSSATDTHGASWRRHKVPDKNGPRFYPGRMHHPLPFLFFLPEFVGFMLEVSASAVAALMQQHRHELMRFLAQRIKCSEDAQDIFQETFIRYAQYDHKDQVGNARAFIFRIAANLATDYLRSQARRSHADLDAEHIAETIADPRQSVEGSIVSQQQLELLIAALAELPPKCREVFILLRLKNQSYTEVQQRLGISQTMILNYLNRALTHCREKLGGV